MIASDAPGVYDVIRQVEAADEMHHRMSASDVADMVEGRTKDFWIDALVGIDSDNRICAVAAVRVLASLSDHAAAEVNAYTRRLRQDRAQQHTRCGETYYLAPLPPAGVFPHPLLDECDPSCGIVHIV